MQHLLDTANSNSGSAAGNVRRLTESIADAASHFHYMGYHTHATSTVGLLTFVFPIPITLFSIITVEQFCDSL
jgi:hypothetical protein